ncbi:uncharacterized protein CBL_13996 [Carabus blaptoides fortunei]
MAMKRNLLSILTYKLAFNKFSHTWSPLAAVFNSKPTQKINLNVLKNNKGLFDVPELQSHEGFYALKERCIIQTDQLIQEATSKNRSRKMVEIFDELSDTLCKVADLAEFIRIAHPSGAYSKAAEIACVTVSSIVEKLNTNYELYAALKNVVDNGDIMNTTDVDKHVARLFLFDFEQCGIHLPESERRQVVELNDAILHLGQHFVTGTAKPRTIQRKCLSEEIRRLFQVDGDNLLIYSLYADSNDPIAREFAYRIFLHPDKHQEYLLMKLLSCRNELAQTCGFQTYSERALKGSLAECPEVVSRFLDMLSDALRPRVEEDFKEMSRIKLNECGPNFGNVAAWDVPYFSQKVKRDIFRVASNEYAPYFSLGACMEGLDLLMKSLYGVSFVHTELTAGESWSMDVYKLAVTHESEGLLGYIYCDLYERAGKPNQDCHFTIQGGKELAGGSYQLPVVVLMLNLPIPRWSSPSLLSPGMVDNLFHEMGHAMHSMLARTKYQHVTVIRGYSTCFEEDPLNRQRGDRYRHECLAHGGGKPPRQLVGDFLQREVTPTKLVDSLVKEIDEKTRQVRHVEAVS